MRVLFVSSSPINTQTSIGNTFLNLFDGFDAELTVFTAEPVIPTKKSKALFALPKLSLLKTYLTAKKSAKRSRITKKLRRRTRALKN